MKKLLTALTLLSLSLFTQAEESQGMSCKEVAEFVGGIMHLRQQGTPIAELYEKAGGNKVIESVIILAYEVPKFSTDEYKQEQVNKFKEEFFLACIKD